MPEDLELGSRAGISGQARGDFQLALEAVEVLDQGCRCAELQAQQRSGSASRDLPGGPGCSGLRELDGPGDEEGGPILDPGFLEQLW